MITVLNSWTKMFVYLVKQIEREKKYLTRAGVQMCLIRPPIHAIINTKLQQKLSDLHILFSKHRRQCVVFATKYYIDAFLRNRHVAMLLTDNDLSKYISMWTAKVHHQRLHAGMICIVIRILNHTVPTLYGCIITTAVGKFYIFSYESPNLLYLTLTDMLQFNKK